MSPENETPVTPAPSPADNPIVKELTEANAALQAELSKAKALVGDFNLLNKQATRGKRFEELIKGQVEQQRIGLNENQKKALENVPLEQQLGIIGAFNIGSPVVSAVVATPTEAPPTEAPPTEAPPAPAPAVVAAPVPPPTAPPPVQVASLDSGFEVEKANMARNGTLNSTTLHALVQKYRGKQ